jgi:hypothetical protein
VKQTVLEKLGKKAKKSSRKTGMMKIYRLIYPEQLQLDQAVGETTCDAFTLKPLKACLTIVDINLGLKVDLTTVNMMHLPADVSSTFDDLSSTCVSKHET